MTCKVVGEIQERISNKGATFYSVMNHEPFWMLVGFVAFGGEETGGVQDKGESGVLLRVSPIQEQNERVLCLARGKDNSCLWLFAKN
jgi:hypothetical protein